MNVNEILKQLRKKKNLTQAEAALKLDVSLSSYQKYERDKNSVMPSIDVLLRLADFYNVSLDYILGREPKTDPFADLEIDEDSVDVVYEKFKSLPEHLQAAAMKILIELADAAQLRYEQKQLAEELSKTRQTAVTGEILDQWEREQQARKKDAG